MLDIRNLETLAKKKVCNMEMKGCADRTCSDCKMSRILPLETASTDITSFFQWERPAGETAIRCVEVIVFSNKLFNLIDN